MYASEKSERGRTLSVAATGVIVLLTLSMPSLEGKLQITQKIPEAPETAPRLPPPPPPPP
eukprot:COSAG02_NODE_20745_length_817_cov_0.906685_1_plen_59_part_10